MTETMTDTPKRTRKSVGGGYVLQEFKSTGNPPVETWIDIEPVADYAAGKSAAKKLGRKGKFRVIRSREFSVEIEQKTVAKVS